MRLPTPFFLLALILVLTSLAPLAGYADGELEYVIRGVDDPLKSNIQNHMSALRFGRQTRPADGDFDRFVADSIVDAKEALRPYGYYAPEIDGRMRRGAEGQPILELNVEPGPPVIIETLQLQIVGQGANSRTLGQWKRNWPLLKGGILNQVTWSQQKQRARLRSVTPLVFWAPSLLRTLWKLISSGTERT